MRNQRTGLYDDIVLDIDTNILTMPHNAGDVILYTTGKIDIDKLNSILLWRLI